MNTISGSVSCMAVLLSAAGHSPAFPSLLQTGISLTISVLSCTAYYLAKAPNHLSFRFALSVALLFAASLTVCRTLLLERKHQVSLHLAMPASTDALVSCTSVGLYGQSSLRV